MDLLERSYIEQDALIAKNYYVFTQLRRGYTKSEYKEIKARAEYKIKAELKQEAEFLAKLMANNVKGAFEEHMFKVRIKMIESGEGFKEVSTQYLQSLNLKDHENKIER